MEFRDPPHSAVWLHRDARHGFEVVALGRTDGGFRFVGQTTAVEAGDAWAVRYAIEVDGSWRTRRARVTGVSPSGAHELTVEADGVGGWRVNGGSAPHLGGCLDVDLESSAFTNALPVHTLGLDVGDEAEAPAAYVRALDLSVERLEQTYARLEDDEGRQRYRYAAPAFDFEAELVYDEFGLVLDYPGIAARAALPSFPAARRGRSRQGP
jgi:hypothetical protein